MNVYFDEKKRQVNKVRIYHTDKYPVKYEEFRYLDIDFNYKKFTPLEHARDYLYAKDGMLHKPYKYFQIIDNRR